MSITLYCCPEVRFVNWSWWQASWAKHWHLTWGSWTINLLQVLRAELLQKAICKLNVSGFETQAHLSLDKAFVIISDPTISAICPYKPNLLNCNTSYFKKDDCFCNYVTCVFYCSWHYRTKNIPSLKHETKVCHHWLIWNNSAAVKKSRCCSI